MNSVNIATLKNELSQYLVIVRRGGEVIVTDRRTPIARIVPYGPPEASAMDSRTADDWANAQLADLARKGVVRRGKAADLKRWADRHRPARLPRGASAVRELVRARRESKR